jgi:hypothetical protein
MLDCNTFMEHNLCDNFAHAKLIMLGCIASCRSKRGSVRPIPDGTLDPFFIIAGGCRNQNLVQVDEVEGMVQALQYVLAQTVTNVIAFALLGSDTMFCLR